MSSIFRTPNLEASESVSTPAATITSQTGGSRQLTLDAQNALVVDGTVKATVVSAPTATITSQTGGSRQLTLDAQNALVVDGTIKANTLAVGDAGNFTDNLGAMELSAPIRATYQNVTEDSNTLVRKGYVDAFATGVQWNKCVKSRVADPPLTPNPGDRHINTTTKQIIEWVTDHWVTKDPALGMAVLVTDEGKSYMYLDPPAEEPADWYEFGISLEHQSLIGCGVLTHANIDGYLDQGVKTTDTPSWRKISLVGSTTPGPNSELVFTDSTTGTNLHMKMVNGSMTISESDTITGEMYINISDIYFSDHNVPCGFLDVIEGYGSGIGGLPNFYVSASEIFDIQCKNIQIKHVLAPTNDDVILLNPDIQGNLTIIPHGGNTRIDGNVQIRNAADTLKYCTLAAVGTGDFEITNAGSGDVVIKNDLSVVGTTTLINPTVTTKIVTTSIDSNGITYFNSAGKLEAHIKNVCVFTTQASEIQTLNLWDASYTSYYCELKTDGVTGDFGLTPNHGEINLNAASGITRLKRAADAINMVVLEADPDGMLRVNPSGRSFILSDAGAGLPQTFSVPGIIELTYPGSIAIKNSIYTRADGDLFISGKLNAPSLVTSYSNMESSIETDNLGNLVLYPATGTQNIILKCLSLILYSGTNDTLLTTLQTDNYGNFSVYPSNVNTNMRCKLTLQNSSDVAKNTQMQTNASGELTIAPSGRTVRVTDSGAGLPNTLFVPGFVKVTYPGDPTANGAISATTAGDLELTSNTGVIITPTLVINSGSRFGRYMEISNSNFQFSTGSSTMLCTAKWIRIGITVTMSLYQTAIAANANSYFMSQSIIPANFRPERDADFSVTVLGGPILTNGRMVVKTDGYIYIYRSYPTGAFTNGSGVGDPGVTGISCSWVAPFY